MFHNEELHIIWQIKVRCDYKEPYKCDKHEFEHENITNYKILSLNNHSVKEKK